MGPSNRDSPGPAGCEPAAARAGPRSPAGIAAAAILLLATCGCTATHRTSLQYRIEHQYALRDPQFVRSMGQLLGPAIVPGNRVTTYVNGDQAFPAMLQAIARARRSIAMETYIYWSGQIGQQIAAALAERARAGVRVHLLMDWFGSRRIASAQIDFMTAAGVEVQRYNPLIWYDLLRVNHRDHRKLLIVDGEVGFTGGMGIADLWLGNAESPDHWRDSMFRLEGPAVGQMQAAFMDNWMKSSLRVLDGEAYFPALPTAGDDYAQVFYSSPRDGVENVRLMYLLSIAAAQKSIRLSVPYFVPGSLTVGKLVDACNRGVQVEIIVPGARTDSPAVRHASRAKWGPLLEAGVRIYEYEPTMYHCKTMIVDDVWVTVGSANVDNRSFKLNDEANLNVFSEAVAAEQIRIFEQDKGKSHLVTCEEWRNRSLGKRLMEVLAAPFREHL